MGRRHCSGTAATWRERDSGPPSGRPGRRRRSAHRPVGGLSSRWWRKRRHLPLAPFVPLVPLVPAVPLAPAVPLVPFGCGSAPAARSRRAVGAGQAPQRRRAVRRRRRRRCFAAGRRACNTTGADAGRADEAPRSDAAVACEPSCSGCAADARAPLDPAVPAERGPRRCCEQRGGERPLLDVGPGQGAVLDLGAGQQPLGRERAGARARARPTALPLPLLISSCDSVRQDRKRRASARQENPIGASAGITR